MLDYSCITPYLYIGRTPRTADYAHLRELGVGLVINLRVERRPYRDKHQSPIQTLWLPVFDSPLIPIPIHLLKRGVHAALAKIQKEMAVYVHCAAGRHRAVAMGAAILIARGISLEEAIKLIKERRPIADPDIWYIRRRIHKFAREWSGS